MAICIGNSEASNAVTYRLLKCKNRLPGFLCFEVQPRPGNYLLYHRNSCRVPLESCK